MSLTVPYSQGCRLGFGVDATASPWQTGRRVAPMDVEPTVGGFNTTTRRFTVVKSLRDVCNVLQVPPEYALKVQARQVVNPVVKTCLEGIFERNTVTAVFRVTFLQQTKSIPFVRTRHGDSNAEDHDESVTVTEDDGGIKGAEANPGRRHNHVVSAVHIGDELVVILKISSSDEDNFSKFSTSLTEALDYSQEVLDDEAFKRLKEFAANMDKKLKKSYYKNVNCNIRYGCFTENEDYPSSVTGMVAALQRFVDKTVAWADLFKLSHCKTIEVGQMMLKEGCESEKEKEKGRFQKLCDTAREHMPTTSKLITSRSKDSSVDQDSEGFEVVASERDTMYKMKVTLEPDHSKESEVNRATSSPQNEYPQMSREQYEYGVLFQALVDTEEADNKLQSFFNEKIYLTEDHQAQGKTLLRRIYEGQQEIKEAIQNMDMISAPSERVAENMDNTALLNEVNDYIENVTSRLPPGCNLDLLVMGKTGHGKSSTANSILGGRKFSISDNGEADTQEIGVDRVTIDGRTIKIIDTPGVCDTDPNLNNIDRVIKSFSDAIAECSSGFHALLLVIRYGTRMTPEEIEAIVALKRTLGENVIRTHGICIVTHGDNFEKKWNSKKTFPEWCREATKELKSLFEECGYRCVLFDNSSDDPKVQKRQMIELVGNVDELDSRGRRYTSDIFEFAQREGNRILSEKSGQQINQETMDKAQSNKQEEEICYKERCDVLSERITQLEKAQAEGSSSIVDAFQSAFEQAMTLMEDRICLYFSQSQQAQTAESKQQLEILQKENADLKAQISEKLAERIKKNEGDGRKDGKSKCCIL